MIKMATGACLAIGERLESVGKLLLYGRTEPQEVSGHAEDHVLKKDEKVAALAKTGI